MKKGGTRNFGGGTNNFGGRNLEELGGTRRDQEELGGTGRNLFSITHTTMGKFTDKSSKN